MVYLHLLSECCRVGARGPCISVCKNSKTNKITIEKLVGNFSVLN